MNLAKIKLGRRRFIQAVSAISLSAGLAPLAAVATQNNRIRRAIPSSGEQLPVIGLGTSGAFDVGDDKTQQASLQKVLQAFFDEGGSVIDTSPMYGSAEYVLGKLLPHVSHRQALFTATKVWTEGRQAGIEQMRESQRLLGVPVIDLMQVHNMLDWRVQLETLRTWKDEGRIRYIGMTTHRGFDHDTLTEIMRSEPLDFVQFSYNLANREAENFLLPLAAERGIATLINRPFLRGNLFRRVKSKPLPEWAAEFDCTSWGQFFLKFLVSHPAVTCAIPSTAKVHHLLDNMGAGYGRLPDAGMRKRMIEYYAAI